MNRPWVGQLRCGHCRPLYSKADFDELVEYGVTDRPTHLLRQDDRGLRPAGASRKVGSSIRVAAGGTCMRGCRGFDQHTVDVDLDCGNREEFPGPHQVTERTVIETGVVEPVSLEPPPPISMKTLRSEVAPAHFVGSLILDPAGHYSTNDFPRALSR